MGAEHRLKTQLTEEQVRQLKLGDTVYLDGELVIMAGPPTFERALEYIEQGKKMPVRLEEAVIFHGPNYNRPVGDQHEIIYINPTSSIRFEAYTPSLIRKCKVRAVVGKGGLGQGSLKAMQEVGCVYLAVLGGGTPLLTSTIKEVASANWLDLIHQFRLMTIRVEGFGPATVAMDAHGNSLFENIRLEAEKKLQEILSELSQRRPDFSCR